MCASPRTFNYRRAARRHSSAFSSIPAIVIAVWLEKKRRNCRTCAWLKQYCRVPRTKWIFNCGVIDVYDTRPFVVEEIFESRALDEWINWCCAVGNYEEIFWRLVVGNAREVCLETRVLILGYSNASGWFKILFLLNRNFFFLMILKIFSILCLLNN